MYKKGLICSSVTKFKLTKSDQSQPQSQQAKHKDLSSRAQFSSFNITHSLMVYPTKPFYWLWCHLTETLLNTRFTTGSFRLNSTVFLPIFNFFCQISIFNIHQLIQVSKYFNLYSLTLTIEIIFFAQKWFFHWLFGYHEKSGKKGEWWLKHIYRVSTKSDF